MAQLIDGYQTPYGMELLPSVHWVAKYEGANSTDQALEKIQQWNSRKKQIMSAAHVMAAWNHLAVAKWV